MDEGGGGGLFGLVCGLGLGVWAMAGHRVAVGALAVLVMVASMAWLSASEF